MGMAPWQLGRGVVGGFSKPRLIGSGVPSDSLGELGNYYYDSSANRWYLKRWCGRQSGVSDVVAIPKAIRTSYGDFYLKFLINASASTGKQDIFVDGYAGTWNGFRAHINIGTAGSPYTIRASLRNTSGEQFGVSSSAIASYVWTKVEISVAAGVLSIIVNSGTPMSVACDGWTPSNANASRFFTTNSNSIIMIADAVSSIFSLPYSDGSGTTVRDASGNGNNGTLSDEAPTDFWAASWVPMDLLS